MSFPSLFLPPVRAMHTRSIPHFAVRCTSSVASQRPSRISAAPRPSVSERGERLRERGGCDTKHLCCIILLSTSLLFPCRKTRSMFVFEMRSSIYVVHMCIHARAKQRTTAHIHCALTQTTHIHFVNGMTYISRRNEK